MVASTRRIGAETSKTRAALLDATERLMLEEGYAAVSSRRVAAMAGVKPPLVHYYFPTMDELFLALFRRGAEANLDRQTSALTSRQPLRALWKLANERERTALTTEFMALGAHRPVIGAEIAAYADRFRARQLEGLSSVLEGYGIDPESCPPVTVLFAMTGVSRLLVLEDCFGVTAGHAETLALVERLLRAVEGEADRTSPVANERRPRASRGC